MTSVKDEVAKNILYYRKKNGLTQKQLAELLGVKHNAISSWENGTNSIDMDTLFNICKVFKISISEVFGIYGKTENEVTTLEYNHIKKYRELDIHGKKMVDFTLQEEWERSVSEHKTIEIAPTISKSNDHLTVQAAHARTDIEHTPEGQAHDDAIMDDDSEWESITHD